METTRRRIDGKVAQKDIQDLGGAEVEDACAVSEHGAVCGCFRGTETAVRRADGLDKSLDWVGEHG